MCGGDVINGKPLVDADFDVARGHLGKQMLRNLLAGGMIGNMREQRRARDFEGSFLAQYRGAKWGDRT